MKKSKNRLKPVKEPSGAIEQGGHHYVTKNSKGYPRAIPGLFLGNPRAIVSQKMSLYAGNFAKFPGLSRAGAQNPRASQGYMYWAASEISLSDPVEP